MSRSNVEAVKARLAKIRNKVVRLADDRWGHETSDKGDRIVIMRAVFGSDGKKAGYEAPVALCTFGPDATTFEKELVRDAVEDLAFVLDQLTRAGEMIRDLRSASRDAPAAQPPVAPAGRRTSADARSGLPPAADGTDQPSKNYAAEAAMKCNEALFQTYLSERHATDDDGDLSDSANAAAVQRRALGIGARSELNTDPEAAQRWRDMRADFQAWGQQ